MAELNYKVNPEEQESSFDAIPAGEYLAVIESSDYIDNKAGTGKILKLVYQIIDGPFKGSKVFENLNLENASTQAEQIARKSLNSIGVAVGVPHIRDSAELHNIPLKIDVTIKDSADYGKQNRIKKHIGLKESTKPVQTQAEPTTSNVPPVAPKSGKKPWENR